jgi:hypothetical protein
MGKERENGEQTVNHDVTHENLVAALKKLRVNTGLSRERLGQNRQVIQAIANRAGGGNLSLPVALTKLLELIAELDDGKHGSAVRNALGIGFSDAPRTGLRREEFAIESGVHTDTVELWENKGFETLASLLEIADSRYPRVKYESLNMERIVNFRGCARIDTLTSRTVRSHVDGLKVIHTSGSRRVDLDPEYTTFEGILGCRLLSYQLSTNEKVRYCFYELDRPLDAGQEANIVTRSYSKGTEEALPREIFIPSPLRPIRSLRIRLQFDQPITKAWLIDGSERFQDDWVPENYPAIASLNPFVVEAAFSDMLGGLRYGVAWEWPGLSQRWGV